MVGIYIIVYSYFILDLEPVECSTTPNGVWSLRWPIYTYIILSDYRKWSKLTEKIIRAFEKRNWFENNFDLVLPKATSTSAGVCFGSFFIYCER